jgi:hypothetical protein
VRGGFSQPHQSAGSTSFFVEGTEPGGSATRPLSGDIGGPGSTRTTTATCTERNDGTYLVKLRVFAKKLRDDGRGVETEVPVDDWIDIGIFGAGGDNSTLYLEKHRITERDTSIELVVDERPSRAGIDPLNKLIDRDSKDNVAKVTDAMSVP